MGNGSGSPFVSVFNPTPLLTVTVEADSEGEPEMHVHAGGQGFWVARLIARFGEAVSLCAPLGGDAGLVLRTLIETEGVTLNAVEAAGACGSYLHDRREGERREICSVPGRPLTRHESDDLFDAALVSGMKAGVTVLTGQHPRRVIPEEMYKRLARDLRANDRLVIADLSGDTLKSALEGGLDAVCISHEELIRDGHCDGDHLGAIRDGMSKLRDSGVRCVIVHRADEPPLAMIGDRLLEIPLPKVEPLDPRGGGDSFMAGLTVGLIRGRSFEDALRLATAAGTLNVTRRGLGTGRKEHIEELSRDIEIHELA